jgi:hypothetical protein
MTTLIEKLDTLRKSWALVFGTTPPSDEILFRWVRIAPLDDIEIAFLKSASWQRTQPGTVTQRQVERRIKNTLFWLRAQPQEAV